MHLSAWKAKKMGPHRGVPRPLRGTKKGTVVLKMTTRPEHEQLPLNPSITARASEQYYKISRTEEVQSQDYLTCMDLYGSTNI